MTHLTDRATTPSMQPAARVSGRAFVRAGANGTIDGEGIGGIYAHDMRLIRRMLVHRAELHRVVVGDVEVTETGCAARFVVEDVQPGTGVLLMVELDGTDLFDVRAEHAAQDDHDSAATQRPTAIAASGLELGAARPDARVRIEVTATGGTLEDSDGIARARVPLVADGTARTGAWRWSVPDSASGPVDVIIELRASWALSTDDQVPPRPAHLELQAARLRASEAWRAALPRMRAPSDIQHVIAASLDDIEQLRLDTPDGQVLAAGAPWFLTIFGRDALLAAWMALPVDAELARATLRYLARHQATRYDIATDAEPGKIQHEERTGVTAQRWHERYYGSVDATPLFLMLLSETHAWTGDDALVNELQQPARRAVDWILARIEDDELDLVGYRRRAQRGLDVQSWKDSPWSQRDRDGLIARGSIRALEVQGYAVAALRGAARLARDVWQDPDAAHAWLEAADRLVRAIDQHFLTHVDGRAIYAQALDEGGARLDAWCSNAAHLLWTDVIRPAAQREEIAAQLQEPELWSGWGVRTMSTRDAGYEPDSYHCGSVWPHDTAIAIAGVARVDEEAAARLARGLFDAADRLGGHLPELFSGAARLEGEQDSAPSLLDGACQPQAWAATAPLLVLRALLGLEPDAEADTLVARAARAPQWLAGLRWEGIQARGQRFDVSVHDDGTITVAAADR